MEAHAPEEGLHAVKVEAVRAEFGIPYAEGRLIHIPGVFSLNHRAGKVHLRILRTPEAGIHNLKVLYLRAAVPGLNHRAGFGHNKFCVALPVEDAGAYAGNAGFRGLECYLLIDYGFAWGKLRGNESAPVGHGSLFCLCDPHITVNTAAGVPAGTFRLVVKHYLYAVLALLELSGKVYGPAGVSVRPAAGLNSVHKHGGVGHCAVHFQANVLLKVFLCHFQGFPIAGLTPPGQFSGLSGEFLIELPFHAPVMGKVHGARATVFGEGPAADPKFTASRLRCG